MDPMVGIVLITTVVLLLAFRPRKPYVIHAHMNKMFMKTFLAVDLGIALAFLPLSWALSKDMDLPEWAVGLHATISMLIMGLAMVYVLYWSQPFSRKRTGVKAVDEAVERYKKSNERAVGVIGGWSPDLVVEGKPYKFFAYGRNDAIGILAFDLQGNIVREKHLMDKLQQCMNFALGFVHPEHINTRTRQYTTIQKAMESLQKRWLMRWQEIPFLRELDSTQVQSLHKGLQSIHENGIGYLDFLEAEAKIGNQYGNTQSRSIDYNDMIHMSTLWEKYGQESLKKINFIRNGVATAQLLKKRLKSGLSKLDEVSQKELLGIIAVLLTQEEKDKLPMLESWEHSGKVTGRYAGLDAESMSAWQSRLEWVDKVDAKRKSK